jgi:hypothetical protein
MPTAPVDSWGLDRLDPFMEPDEASEVAVNLKPSTAYPKGTLLGEITATPGIFAPYASGNTDGTEIPKLILRHSCVTDANGVITYGTSVTTGQFGPEPPSKVTDAYYSGIFKTTDIPGLDAAAVTAMKARLISGTLAAGIIAFPGV